MAELADLQRTIYPYNILVTRQMQVERRTGTVRRPKTDVLPLCHGHATNTVLKVKVRVWASKLFYVCVVDVDETLFTDEVLGTHVLRYTIYSLIAATVITVPGLSVINSC